MEVNTSERSRQQGIDSQYVGGKQPGGIPEWFADDVRYTIIGTTKFSGTFNGKQELLSRAFTPLRAELESPGSMTSDNLIAEGDFVVQQGHGVGRRAKSGEPITTRTASSTSSPMSRWSR